MRHKFAILLIVVFVSIASMQMSFAQEDYAEIVGYGTEDNEVGEDAGVVSAGVNDGGNLIISVYNSYPCYEAYVNFTIKNINDETTIYLFELLIDNAYAGVEMDVALTYLNGDPIPLDTELLPGETMECLVTITMLPAADEDQSYLF